MLLLTLALVAQADLLPDPVTLDVRATEWSFIGGFRTAPTAWPDGGGSRVAAWIEAVGDDPYVEARGVSAAGEVGPWLPLEVTFRGDGVFVAVVDLDRAHWDGAQVRLSARDDARTGVVRWELLHPAYPDAGRISRELGPEPHRLSLDPVLSQIGVIDRATWGARTTTCSSTEDDWYRMAIHHTAGTQTSGGSVQGAVQALQAYSMDSGEYCDIPYQFNVGYDGSLWEARPLNYYSGATYNNNDGNIAISFLGCYHGSGCPTAGGDAATDAMMFSARLLAQTLVELHAIPSDRDSIRGHQEWPDNATACPGDFVLARLDELTWDLPWYTGTLLSASSPFASEGTIALAPGVEQTVTVELRNDGGLPWVPGLTNLAPTPRDSASAVAGASWAGLTRATTVDTTVYPGGTGRFTFTLGSASSIDVVQGFALVQDGVTWFGDGPWGGGPADDSIAFHVVVTGGGEPVDTGSTEETGLGETGDDPGGGDNRPPPASNDDLPPIGNGFAPGRRTAVTGCGCASGGTGVGAGSVVLLAALAARRRR